MEEQRFEPRIILGIDFTSRKKYRNEIKRLKNILSDLRQKYACCIQDRDSYSRMHYAERNRRRSCEAKLAKYNRERGSDGRFIKIEK